MLKNIIFCIFALVASTNSQDGFDFWLDWFGDDFGVTTTSPPQVANCVKRWGECQQNGIYTVQREIIISGTNCVPRTRYGCVVKRPPTVDCVKKWGPCKGTGRLSSKTEIVVTKAVGKECVLKTQYGCNNTPSDCKKAWGPCTGDGYTSYQKEYASRPAVNGGKKCTSFKYRYGCNVKSRTSSNDDTNSKKAGSLFLENFFLDPQKGEAPAVGAGRSRVISGAGSRSLAIGAAGSLPAPGSSQKKDCNKVGEGDNIIAQSCQNIISKKIQEEEDKKFKAMQKKNRKRRRRSSSSISAIPESYSNARDVLFFVDSSGSVGEYRFGILKEVCKAIVDLLCGPIALDPKKTRISMAIFNERQLVVFPFSDTRSTAVVNNRISNALYDRYYDQATCLVDALDFVANKLYTQSNGARFNQDGSSGVVKDMIIMTDGCANCNYRNNPEQLQRAAYRLKLYGINVYAIGIGLKEDCREILKVLARGGRCFHFFYLRNWQNDVEGFLSRLKNPPPGRCLDKWENPSGTCPGGVAA